MARVGIAELKAHLSEYLRQVRSGRIITVLDRELAFARIVPLKADSALDIQLATRAPGEMVLPPPPASPTDSLAVLLEDRASR